jgi:hypothetical protein
MVAADGEETSALGEGKGVNRERSFVDDVTAEDDQVASGNILYTAVEKLGEFFGAAVRVTHEDQALNARERHLPVHLRRQRVASTRGAVFLANAGVNSP